ncbi:tetratricopeptide repeat protein [Rhodopila sp.]|uniref:tetratricopeptide repeat protein n=1 Tax=Rhodopila sp. TaxID=2480087 RepID=UPI003D1108A9
MNKRSQQIEALFRQGQHLHRAGRLAEAENAYRQVLLAMPRHAEALHTLGALALQCGNAEFAEQMVQQAIALKPAADFQLTRAHVLLALRRAEPAAEAARVVLRARPRDAAAHQVLGHALSDAGQPEPAIAAYLSALELQPDLPDIRNNLGTVLRQAGRLAEAEAELRRAPPEPGALVNLSSVQKERGAFVAAEATLRQALRIAPGDPALLYNWSLLMLLLGRPAEAWPGWEQRFRAGATPPRAFTQPQWQGEPLGGRSLLVHTEQGAGDVIQFVRYLPALLRPGIGGSVGFEAPARLIRLLSSNPALPPMVAADTAPPPADTVAPLMSLPARTDLVPADPPYLFAEPDRVAAWGRRIGDAGFRVGINWQGFRGRLEDRGRSFPLALFGGLAGIAGVRLISLQKGDGEDQVAGAGFALETLDGLDAGPDGFLDTAAVMATLDLVVTSDTSIAHLAGALGRPVWVALRLVPDWRWMLDRTDSPWYPTMRLFRQTRDGDWGPVFAAIADALAGVLGDGWFGGGIGDRP